MDTTALVNPSYMALILGDISLQQFVIYLICAIFGLCVSFLLELLKNWKEITTKGGFSPSYWLKRNFLRCLIFVIIMVAIILFGDIVDMKIPSAKAAFGLGFFIDRSIDAFIKKKK